MILKALIVVAALVAMFCWLEYLDRQGDCPRIELGYNCKGNKCDHSPEAWERINEHE